MSNETLLHPDRLFPVEEKTKNLARDLYALVQHAPILSPHGHTDPIWFADNKNFTDPVSLLITPDHYILRMLYSQGLGLELFGVKKFDDSSAISEAQQKSIWKLFAENFYLFRGTPSALWMRHVFHEVFGIQKEFSVESADFFFNEISSRLKLESYKPRALFERFKIAALATTDAATDDLNLHKKIKTDWGKRVIPTYRPDAATDPEHEDFFSNLALLEQQTGENVTAWSGYLNAHRKRRQYFKEHGATATDHGHPTAQTTQLSQTEAEALFSKILQKKNSTQESELFRAHMLWQFASMSLDDGLVMQLHAGAYRNHNPHIFQHYGRDKGADVPAPMEYIKSLKPLLDSFGNSTNLKLILFTLDESTYSRELAPLAGHYPCLRLGPAWWFHDSPEGMLRHRRQCMETAGFYNITGFIDDTRAFLSIPARHDMSRRIDARLLAELVAEHRLSFTEAADTIVNITGPHAAECFRL